MLARLSKLETPAAPAAPAAPTEDKKPEVEIEMSARIKAAIELAAREAALATIKQFSLSAPAPSAPSAPSAPKAEKKFEEVVRELKSGGKQHNDAIRAAMDAAPTAHAAYLSRVQSGELILF